MDRRLRSVWSQVLDVDDADLDDDINFFEVGGDSVAALRLVTAAAAVGITLGIEDVFNHPTLEQQVEKCQEATHVSKPKDSTSELSTLDQDTVDACATACQVDRDTIEDIFPVSPFQNYFFKYGNFLVLQYVFEMGGDFDRTLLKEAWDRVQRKHQILRTRLAPIRDDHLQIVLRSDMEWQEGKNLADYKRQSLSEPIKSGQPLFRYAVITEGDGSYFVWTAHHAGFDAWTRRMIFEHLQESLSQPLEYTRRPNSVSFKSFITWSQNRQAPVSSNYWETALEGFTKFECVYPMSLPRLPMTSSKLYRSWQHGSAHKKNFTMATVVHAAYAISLGNMSGLHDVLFVTTRTGRYNSIPGVETIFGPMYVLNPVRVKLQKEQTLGDFLQSMQTQLVSMTVHERDGETLIKNRLGYLQAFQTYISWHPKGEDDFSKEIPFKNREGVTGSLKPRRDLSVLSRTAIGVALNIFEQESSVDFRVSWDDNLRSQFDIEQLMADLFHNLDQLMGSRHLTVGDLWPGKGRQWTLLG